MLRILSASATSSPILAQSAPMLRSAVSSCFGLAPAKLLRLLFSRSCAWVAPPGVLPLDDPPPPVTVQIPPVIQHGPWPPVAALPPPPPPPVGGGPAFPPPQLGSLVPHVPLPEPGMTPRFPVGSVLAIGLPP